MMWDWGYNASWMWLWGAFMMAIFWGGLIALVVWAVRASRGGPEAPAEILRRRLARGEITPEEYETARRILQG